MKESHRVSRVEREIQQILAQYILRNITFPAGVLVTVTRVQSTKELRTAKVFLSFMGDDSVQEEAFEALEERRQLVQQHLNKSMHMKFVPRISFVVDKGLDHMLRIEGLLRDIEDSNGDEEE